MKNIREGILIGKDHFGRGVVLTPEGEYRHAFVSSQAQPGDVIQIGTSLSFRTAMALSAALTGVACVLISLAVNLSTANTVKVAAGFFPDPPRAVVYATLYLKSQSGDPVALDLDQQGHVVTVRILGERIARQEIVGRPVADVLQNQDRLLAGVKIVPGEPLGLQVRKSDSKRLESGGNFFDLRSMKSDEQTYTAKSV